MTLSLCRILQNVIQTQNSKVHRNWLWLCDGICVLPWWYFCGSGADAKNLCQSLILAAIKEYSLNASAVKLIILLEILTSFAAFAADLASIHNFRSVVRRHETKINQNVSAVTCGLVVLAPAWDGTGPEFDPWQCRKYLPCSLSLRLLGSWVHLSTYGLTQKVC